MFTLIKVIFLTTAVTLSGQARSSEPMISTAPNQDSLYQKGVWPMVEHAFQVDHPSEAIPFTLQIWAVVEKPEQTTKPQTVTVPAFYDGDKIWKIRYSPDRPGTHRVVDYRIGEMADSTVKVTPLTAKEFIVDEGISSQRGYIRCSEKFTQQFVFDDGTPYFPIGYNTGWGTPDEYSEIFQSMNQCGLNWARVWMVHWAGTNLDWVMNVKMEPGQLDLDVARRWDAIIQSAEENQIAVQFVLQNHGQYSMTVNPTWQSNPWNVANGGWLENASDFFTDEKARDLTKAKYHYIVARWGYSPAIMAWEIFNEVEFTNGYIGEELVSLWSDVKLDENLDLETGKKIFAILSQEKYQDSFGNPQFLENLGNAWKEISAGLSPSQDFGLGRFIVARWHSEMAEHIRRVDPYDHLVTTSSIAPDSPIWEEMDYYQIHLYRRKMLEEVATLPREHQWFRKPVFIAEMGDHQIQNEDKIDGRYMHAMMWAGLFSGAAGAAQVWAWDRVETLGLYTEFSKMKKFCDAAQYADLNYKPDSVTFTPQPAPVGETIKPGAFALTAPGQMVIWLYDEMTIHRNAPNPVSGIVTLPSEVISHKELKISWWNTRTGEIIKQETVHPNQIQQLSTPMFSGDVAAIIEYKVKS